MNSKWFNIGKGPALDAAKPLLDALRDHRESGSISGYRIGDRRYEDNVRQLEIVFKSSDDLKVFVGPKY